jgi:hypothetical protein
MADAGNASARQDTYSLTWREGLVRLLGNCHHPAAIQPDGDLKAFSTGDTFFDGRAGKSATDSAKDCSDRTTTATANSAACHTTYNSTCRRTDRCFGTLNLHLTHALNDAHFNILSLPGLGTAISAPGHTGGTTGKYHHAGTRYKQI